MKIRRRCCCRYRHRCCFCTEANVDVLVKGTKQMSWYYEWKFKALFEYG